MQFQDQRDMPLCMYARRGELDTFMTALKIRGVRCELMLSCLTSEFLTEVTRENLTWNFDRSQRSQLEHMEQDRQSLP